MISVRDVCAANGPKLAMAIFGPAGLYMGEPTEYCMELLKGMVMWSWGRQRRGGLKRVKNREQHELKYIAALEKLTGMNANLPNVQKSKIAKAALAAAIEYGKTLRITQDLSMTAEREVEKVMKETNEMIAALKGEDGKCSCCVVPSDLV